LSKLRRSAVRREIAEITERFEQADRRARAAQTVEDWEAAEAERREINGQFWVATEDLASLFLLLLRHAPAQARGAFFPHSYPQTEGDRPCDSAG
jgi:hypothetical protein